MKISCYNKGTKKKETNKKCLRLSKYGERTDELLVGSRRGSRQDAAGTWHKIKERRV